MVVTKMKETVEAFNGKTIKDVKQIHSMDEVNSEFSW